MAGPPNEVEELTLHESALRSAEREPEPRFELRGFHNAVPDNGAMPLPVLERQIEKWITSQPPG